MYDAIIRDKTMDVKIIRGKPTEKVDICIVGSRICSAGASEPKGFVQATETVRLLWQDPLDETRLRDSICGILRRKLLESSLEVAFDCESFTTAEGELSYVMNVLTFCVQDAVAELHQNHSSTLTVYCVASMFSEDGTQKLGILEKLKKYLTCEHKVPMREQELHCFYEYNFEDFIRSEQQRPKSHLFQTVLLQFIKSTHEKNSKVYIASGITKQTFSKIMKSDTDYTPSRETVAALCIGLKLGIDDAQTLYNAAGYHLGNSIPVDRVIRFFIDQKIYNIDTVNDCLYELGLPIIGAHVRMEKEE